jgi:hypothetical protein
MLPIAAVVLFVLAGGVAQAQERTGERAPRFSDYKVEPTSNPLVKPPIPPRGMDEETRLRLADSVAPDDRANFAGGYFVAVWSCGAACVSGAIVEASSGQVIDIPFTVSGWREVHDDFSGIAFRADSRLIVFSGERNEKGDMGRHYYVLDRGRLRFLTSIAGDGNFLKPPD